MRTLTLFDVVVSAAAGFSLLTRLFFPSHNGHRHRFRYYPGDNSRLRRTIHT